MLDLIFSRSLYGKFLSTGISVVARFWTRSTALISPMKCGLHMMLPYSRWGRATDVNRRGRVATFNATNDNLINPRIEFAFFTAADVCVWNSTLFPPWDNFFSVNTFAPKFCDFRPKIFWPILGSKRGVWGHNILKWECLQGISICCKHAWNPFYTYLQFFCGVSVTLCARMLFSQFRVNFGIAPFWP